MSETTNHGYTWKDARRMGALSLEPGDVFVTLAAGTAYREAADGTVRGHGIAWQMPMEGTAWTVAFWDREVMTARSDSGAWRTQHTPDGAAVLRVATGAPLSGDVVPAEEIQPGDVIAYPGGGLMMVTRPGRRERVAFTSERVGHHGVVMTTPGDPWREGDTAVSDLFTPRAKVRVFERRAFSAGDKCICVYCAAKRGEVAAALPPVVTADPVGQTQEEPAPALEESAPLAPVARTRRRRGGPLMSARLSKVLEDGHEPEALDADDSRAVRRLAERAGLVPPAAPVAAERPEDEGRTPAAEALESAPWAIPWGLAVGLERWMGGGWHAKAPRYGAEPAAYLEHTDGRRIQIERDGKSAAHVVVSVVYPSDAPVKVYEVDKPVTRFMHTRPVPKLADAIMSKLMPIYRPRFEEVKAAVEEKRKREAEEEGFMARLAAMVPDAEVNGSWVEFHRHGSMERMRAEVSAGALHTVTFRYTDRRKLEALVQAFGTLVKADDERRAADKIGRGVELA